MNPLDPNTKLKGKKLNVYVLAILAILVCFVTYKYIIDKDHHYTAANTPTDMIVVTPADPPAH